MRNTKSNDLPSHPKTTADWQKWLAYDLAIATRTLVRTGSVSQIFVLHSSNGTTQTFAAPFTSDEQRRAVLMYFRARCIAHHVVGFSVINEAWMAAVAGKAEAIAIDRGEGRMPSQRETRREVVQVSLIYRLFEKRRALGAMREIIRGADGRATGVTMPDGFPADVEVDANFGAIPGILLPETPPQSQVIAAQDVLAQTGPAFMRAFGVVEVS